MLAPLLGLILAMILLSRRRVLSIWRDGVATEGLVIDARQSSIAPRSKMIRYVHADGEDQTVRAVLCPAGLAPAGGQPIRIVHAPGNPDRAIAADLYL
ncbi:MAG: hypothetical protein NZ561_12865 [Phycisphaerae bacterium]|nr:hypothetical protein [Phycisphaerae bacterium]